MRKYVLLNAYTWVCILRKDRKICRTDAMGRGGDGQTYAGRRTNLFLSVLCFSFRFCVSPSPPRSSPSPSCSSFRALRSRFAQSSLIRAWLSAGRILRHRNGQLLTENYRLFALEFFIIEHRFYLNFTDDKINGTRFKMKGTYRKSDSCPLDYILIEQHTSHLIVLIN